MKPMGDNEIGFGCFAADIIASSRNLIGNNGEKGFADAVAADKIVFVMKAGKIYKKDGKPVV